MYVNTEYEEKMEIEVINFLEYRLNDSINNVSNATNPYIKEICLLDEFTHKYEIFVSERIDCGVKCLLQKKITKEMKSKTL